MTPTDYFTPLSNFALSFLLSLSRSTKSSDGSSPYIKPFLKSNGQPLRCEYGKPCPPSLICDMRSEFPGINVCYRFSLEVADYNISHAPAGISNNLERSPGSSDTGIANGLLGHKHFKSSGSVNSLGLNNHAETDFKMLKGRHIHSMEAETFDDTNNLISAELITNGVEKESLEFAPVVREEKILRRFRYPSELMFNPLLKPRKSPTLRVARLTPKNKASAKRQGKQKPASRKRKKSSKKRLKKFNGFPALVAKSQRQLFNAIIDLKARFLEESRKMASESVEQNYQKHDGKRPINFSGSRNHQQMKKYQRNELPTINSPAKRTFSNFANFNKKPIKSKLIAKPQSLKSTRKRKPQYSSADDSWDGEIEEISNVKRFFETMAEKARETSARVSISTRRITATTQRPTKPATNYWNGGTIANLNENQTSKKQVHQNIVARQNPNPSPGSLRTDQNPHSKYLQTHPKYDDSKSRYRNRINPQEFLVNEGISDSAPFDDDRSRDVFLSEQFQTLLGSYRVDTKFHPNGYYSYILENGSHSGVTWPVNDYNIITRRPVRRKDSRQRTTLPIFPSKEVLEGLDASENNNIPATTSNNHVIEKNKPISNNAHYQKPKKDLFINGQKQTATTMKTLGRSETMLPRENRDSYNLNIDRSAYKIEESNTNKNFPQGPIKTDNASPFYTTKMDMIRPAGNNRKEVTSLVPKTAVGNNAASTASEQNYLERPAPLYKGPHHVETKPHEIQHKTKKNRFVWNYHSEDPAPRRHMSFTVDPTTINIRQNGYPEFHKRQKISKDLHSGHGRNQIREPNEILNYKTTPKYGYDKNNQGKDFRETSPKEHIPTPFINYRENKLPHRIGMPSFVELPHKIYSRPDDLVKSKALQAGSSYNTYAEDPNKVNNKGSNHMTGSDTYKKEFMNKIRYPPIKTRYVGPYMPQSRYPVNTRSDLASPLEVTNQRHYLGRIPITNSRKYGNYGSRKNYYVTPDKSLHRNKIQNNDNILKHKQSKIQYYNPITRKQFARPFHVKSTSRPKYVSEMLGSSQRQIDKPPRLGSSGREPNLRTHVFNKRLPSNRVPAAGPGFDRNRQPLISGQRYSNANSNIIPRRSELKRQIINKKHMYLSGPIKQQFSQQVYPKSQYINKNTYNRPKPPIHPKHTSGGRINHKQMISASERNKKPEYYYKLATNFIGSPERKTYSQPGYINSYDKETRTHLQQQPITRRQLPQTPSGNSAAYFQQSKTFQNPQFTNREANLKTYSTQRNNLPLLTNYDVNKQMNNQVELTKQHAKYITNGNYGNYDNYTTTENRNIRHFAPQNFHKPITRSPQPKQSPVRISVWHDNSNNWQYLSPKVPLRRVIRDSREIITKKYQNSRRIRNFEDNFEKQLNFDRTGYDRNHHYNDNIHLRQRPHVLIDNHNQDYQSSMRHFNSEELPANLIYDEYEAKNTEQPQPKTLEFRNHIYEGYPVTPAVFTPNIGGPAQLVATKNNRHATVLPLPGVTTKTLQSDLVRHQTPVVYEIGAYPQPRASRNIQGIQQKRHPYWDTQVDEVASISVPSGSTTSSLPVPSKSLSRSNVPFDKPPWSKRSTFLPKNNLETRLKPKRPSDIPWKSGSTFLPQTFNDDYRHDNTGYREQGRKLPGRTLKPRIDSWLPEVHSTSQSTQKYAEHPTLIPLANVLPTLVVLRPTTPSPTRDNYEPNEYSYSGPDNGEDGIDQIVHIVDLNRTGRNTAAEGSEDNTQISNQNQNRKVSTADMYAIMNMNMKRENSRSYITNNKSNRFTGFVPQPFSTKTAKDNNHRDTVKPITSSDMYATMKHMHRNIHYPPDENFTDNPDLEPINSASDHFNTASKTTRRHTKRELPQEYTDDILSRLPANRIDEEQSLRSTSSSIQRVNRPAALERHRVGTRGSNRRSRPYRHRTIPFVDGRLINPTDQTVSGFGGSPALTALAARFPPRAALLERTSPTKGRFTKKKVSNRPYPGRPFVGGRFLGDSHEWPLGRSVVPPNPLDSKEMVASYRGMWKGRQHGTVPTNPNVRTMERTISISSIIPRSTTITPRISTTTTTTSRPATVRFGIRSTPAKSFPLSFMRLKSKNLAQLGQHHTVGSKSALFALPRIAVPKDDNPSWGLKFGALTAHNPASLSFRVRPNYQHTEFFKEDSIRPKIRAMNLVSPSIPVSNRRRAPAKTRSPNPHFDNYKLANFNKSFRRLESKNIESKSLSRGNLERLGSTKDDLLRAEKKKLNTAMKTRTTTPLARVKKYSRFSQVGNPLVFGRIIDSNRAISDSVVGGNKFTASSEGIRNKLKAFIGGPRARYSMNFGFAPARQFGSYKPRRKSAKRKQVNMHDTIDADKSNGIQKHQRMEITKVTPVSLKNNFLASTDDKVIKIGNPLSHKHGWATYGHHNAERLQSMIDLDIAQNDDVAVSHASNKLKNYFVKPSGGVTLREKILRMKESSKYGVTPATPIPTTTVTPSYYKIARQRHDQFSVGQFLSSTTVSTTFAIRSPNRSRFVNSAHQKVSTETKARSQSREKIKESSWSHEQVLNSNMEERNEHRYPTTRYQPRVKSSITKQTNPNTVFHGRFYASDEAKQHAERHELHSERSHQRGLQPYLEQHKRQVTLYPNNYKWKPDSRRRRRRPDDIDTENRRMARQEKWEVSRNRNNPRLHENNSDYSRLVQPKTYKNRDWKNQQANQPQELQSTGAEINFPHHQFDSPRHQNIRSDSLKYRQEYDDKRSTKQPHSSGRADYQQKNTRHHIKSSPFSRNPHGSLNSIRDRTVAPRFSSSEGRHYTPKKSPQQPHHHRNPSYLQNYDGDVTNDIYAPKSLHTTASSKLPFSIEQHNLRFSSSPEEAVSRYNQYLMHLGGLSKWASANDKQRSDPRHRFKVDWSRPFDIDDRKHLVPRCPPINQVHPCRTCESSKNCPRGLLCCPDHHNQAFCSAPLGEEYRYEPKVMQLVNGTYEPVGLDGIAARGTITLIRAQKQYILVDTGTPIQEVEIHRSLVHHDLRPEDISVVINTHAHPQHFSNQNIFPNALHIFNDTNSMGDLFWENPMKMGHDYSLCGGDLKLIRTPGHTQTDVSVMLKKVPYLDRVAVVGDVFLDERDVYVDTFQQRSENISQQRKSRKRVICNADYIIPGHGAMFRVNLEMKILYGCDVKRKEIKSQ